MRRFRWQRREVPDLPRPERDIAAFCDRLRIDSPEPARHRELVGFSSWGVAVSTGSTLYPLSKLLRLNEDARSQKKKSKATRSAFLRKIAPLVLLGIAVAACGIVDRFEDRLEHMNRSVDVSRNQLILLNVARAQYNHPLTFVAVTSVSGAQGASGNFGLPTFTIGPGQTDAQHQFVFGNNSVSGSLGGNVGVTPLESREFYMGLLEPIGLNAAQFFVAQGYPRQILFFLFMESLRFRGARGEKILWNDPTDPNFPEFVEYLHHWVDLGVSIEQIPGQPDKRKLRLCFDRALARVPLAGFGPICGVSKAHAVGLTGLSYPGLGPVSVTLQTRSTYGVFRYLGRLIDPELGSRVTLRGDRAGGIVFGEDKRLFPVETSAFPTSCLTSVVYQGRWFCIPASGAEQGPLVMQFLAQLLALNVSVKDLPLVPTVRVTN